MSQPLSNAVLAAPPADVSAPSYDRSALRAGVVHIGVGNFHRAHQAAYLDRLFEAGQGFDWAVLGAGVREADMATRTRLARQDWLWTLVEQCAERSQARIVGSMVGFLDPTRMSALVDALADPAIRIVSLTVTEGGYFIDPATGEFDPTAAGVAEDARSIETPKTAFGVILSAMRRRRAAGAPPLTVMSCDNLPGNGHVVKRTMCGLAEHAAPDLSAFLENEISFPNGMVDRITPATSDRERAIVAETYGLDDQAPVFCEDFTQWVLEDDFRSGRPNLEAVGVEFTSDVEPYEIMKLRVLNGGHAVIAYPAALLGVHFVHDAMAEPLISGFLDKVERTEILPMVSPPPGGDALAYLRSAQKRFANPKVGDTVARLAQDGSNRQPKFILPTIRDRLARGLSVSGLAMVSAFWRRFLEDDRSQPIDDPHGPRLRDAALASRDDPERFLAILDDVFGELSSDAAFRSAFADATASIQSLGVEGALRSYLDRE